MRKHKRKNNKKIKMKSKNQVRQLNHANRRLNQDRSSLKLRNLLQPQICRQFLNTLSIAHHSLCWMSLSFNINNTWTSINQQMILRNFQSVQRRQNQKNKRRIYKKIEEISNND
jgi:hypothetical protein